MSVAFRPRRPVDARVHLDTNRGHAQRGGTALHLLEKWHRDGVIELLGSPVAADAGGGSPDPAPAPAHEAPGDTLPPSLTTTPGQHQLRTIEAILSAGRPLDESTHLDAEMVLNAKKYMAILVTADRGILEQRSGLAAQGVEVMTDGEVVEHIRTKIADRDRVTRLMAQHYKQAVPEWVGKD